LIRYWFSALCLSALLLTSVAVIAQETRTATVEAKGMAGIIGGNIANARDKATQDALRQAVEQAMGAMVFSETMTENAAIVSDKISSQTSGYIQSFDVIKSGKSDQEMFTVTVRAIAKIGHLENDLAALGLLIEQVKSPRITVLMRERNMVDAWQDVSVSLGISESVMMNAFLDKSDRFNFMDRSTAQANLDRSQSLAALEGDASAAAAIGLLFGADMIIVGEAFANSNEVEFFGAKTVSAQATATGKMIWTDSGKIVGTDIGTGQFSPVIEKISGGREAITQATSDLAEKLIPRILEDWRKKATQGSAVVVTLKGARFGDLKVFENLVKAAATGVIDVIKRGYAAGVATYEITCKAGPEGLAEELDGQTVKTKMLEVVSLSAGALELTLSKQ
tara:strand:+ start:178 stop:1356 length:1179 start_codon:yes stop_codon:yes gene_type:complete